ncbi:inosine-5'-monophosphate dehydrogenase [mine drainage metagenome]|uniref:Inosine-5'-monophosphate dehydrogenase n=1 Tax=mine drainage metagenome TaxID=410659 RepID=A0A1J5RJR6_9ZZZZ
MKTLKQIINNKTLHFNFVAPDTRVIDAIALMKIENMSYVIVMEGQNYLGIFSEKDYTQKVILQNRNSSETFVKEIMTVDLPIVTSEDSFDKCMEIMNTFKVRYLPMFEGYVFKGVITINDLLEATIEEKKSPEKNEHYLKDAVSTSNSIGHYED